MKELSHRQFLEIDRNHLQAANAVDLYYTTDKEPGIERHKKGKQFSFTFRNKLIRDKEILERIKKLAIPPSWSNVWICSRANGHLQAIGYDLDNRKQYRYHAEWNKIRSLTKFHRLYEFGKALPRIREKIKKDLNSPGLNEAKVIAALINVMELTYIRVGNNGYEKLYGSYGMTTLKDRHVKIEKEKIFFSFAGKKGINHSVSLKSRKLATIIRQCRDIPGKELFQYYTEGHDRKKIDSGMVNNYIKEASGSDFTAKDFRTWAGSLLALEVFCSMREPRSENEANKFVSDAIEVVSKKLGNTKDICRKYYIHPCLIQLYKTNMLRVTMRKVNKKKIKGLSAEESKLMYILKKEELKCP